MDALTHVMFPFDSAVLEQGKHVMLSLRCTDQRTLSPWPLQESTQEMLNVQEFHLLHTFIWLLLRHLRNFRFDTVEKGSCAIVVALLVQATEGSLLPGPYLTLGDFVLSVGSGERLGSSGRGLDPCGCCLSHSQAPLWKALLLPVYCLYYLGKGLSEPCQFCEFP